MLKEAKYYARMSWYFAGYLRQAPISHPRRLLRNQLTRRTENFLDLVRVAVYDNPVNPYYDLLRLAGCEYGDLARMARADGLEPTLEQLRAAGVYLSHAEMKGAPITRQGRTIANDAAATRLLNSAGGIESVSSGSRSGSVATPASNAYRLYREAYDRLLAEELGVQNRVSATLQSILPAPSALVFCAAEARRGRPVERWFPAGGTLRDSGHYRAVTKALITEARLLRMRIPWPEYLTAGDFSPVVEWIAECRDRGQLPVIRGNVSSCTRVASLARDRNVDVSGTVAVTSGETLTAAKRALLEQVGVQPYPRYVITEFGTVGLACRHLRGNSVHWFSDSTAIIAHRRHAPFTDVEVNSLFLTSINPLASRIFINAEMEDEATFAPAACDCEFSRLGFTTILTDVHSFGKLTGHGLTLAGTDFVWLLEHQLPAQFGGAPGDYQLVEQESDRQAEVRLRISPRVTGVSPEDVQAFFLRQVSHLHGGSLSRRIWRQTASFRAEVAEPHRTHNGKVHVLHLSTFNGHHGH